MNAKTSSEIDGETHSIEQPTADRTQHKSWFGKLRQAIVTAFEPQEEPIFYKKRDRNGNVYWQAYDPVSNRSLEFGSDDEARHWLDLRMPFR
ncbi:phage integrase Arm DNA-binding domain-containing protein [Chamaesiphon minutus]|uniref:Uncharacterized protein n=1 Tax=Chamaesiphon minutus (strain ATCC 27169 / PCC 6605) TaxID=1173020 RepID=K9UFU0_CHAP6|nr:phage integrase Arm DNA-binding domain-containing protein [Chamaesiphon minutus]AFY93261.1 hypothetical protein Cha6605_2177 [Chamaesiphon minutus PCC 6605]